MMDMNQNNETFPELQAALENLKKSEQDCAETSARYAQLETIIRKQIKSQFIETIAPVPSKTESTISCKTDSRSLSSSSSKYSSKTSKNSKYSDKVQKKISTNTELSSKKSSGDISKTNPEQSKRAQLVKRIKQCHDSVEEVAMLSGKMISEKKKFLVRLEKSNRDAWRSQKSKQILVGKLEAHMNQ